MSQSVTTTYLDTDSQAKARAIMGKNFLGLVEACRGYAVTFTSEQADQLTEIPFSEETLQAFKDTHVLIAGAPLAVKEIRKLAEIDFWDSNWYRNEPFANDKVSVRWYLIRKLPVPESCSKTYDQQTPLLTNAEVVPFACEVTYMVILYWLTHRERLLPDVYVFCQDKSSDGRRVCVGSFDSDGIDVSSYWDGGRWELLGLASSVPPRKS